MSNCVYLEPVNLNRESVNSNQANYLIISSILNSQTIKRITNMYLEKPIGRIFKSSFSWTQQVEYSSNELIDEYMSFFDSGSSNNVVISSEIKRINNEQLNKFLNDIISEILSQLEVCGKNNNVKIRVEFVKDIEIPNWNEFVISIKLPPTDDIDYEEHFDLWEKIGEKVRAQIALSNVQDKKILENYGNPTIILEAPV